MSQRHLLSCSLALAFAAGALADTLVLRNGRRVEGELIAVRGDTIEFDERGGLGRGRRQRYDRREVRRIELDDSGGSWSERGSGRDDDQDIGRPRGFRERQVSVDSRRTWTDTGIDVRDGQRVRFHASGEVRWGPGRKDGPAGEGGSHANPNRPLPNRPGAALIGKVGEGDDLFFVGDEQGEIRVRGSGRLYLGVNDDYLQDNSGSFRVVVYY